MAQNNKREDIVSLTVEQIEERMRSKLYAHLDTFCSLVRLKKLDKAYNLYKNDIQSVVWQLKKLESIVDYVKD